jgi:hypothetical protein
MDRQRSAWSAYTYAYWDPADLCLWGGLNAVIPQGDLFNAQNKVYRDCFGGTISGLARNVNLNGGCVTECLSNRPDGCS